MLKLSFVVCVVIVSILSLNIGVVSVVAQNWPAKSEVFDGSYATHSAPVFTVFNNNLYMAYSDSSRSIFFASTNNYADWPLSPTQIPGQATNSGSSPAFIGFNNKLILAYHSSGTSNIILTTSSDNGTTWSTPIMLPSAYETVQGPRFVVVNSLLYLHYQGTDNSIAFATSSDGTTWPTTPSKVPNQATSANPALFGWNGKLIVVFKSSGTNNLLSVVSSDGGSTWSTSSVPSFFTTPTAPILTSYGTNVYLMYEGTDNAMYIAVSSNGLTWPNTITRVLPNDATSRSPALQEFNGQLVVAFRSSGSDSLLIAYTSS